MNDPLPPTESLSMRTYYSINFIAAAAHEASIAARIEATYDGFDANKALLHKGAVAASIFLSIAAVEAYINEFFSDCADAHSHHLVGLEHQAIDRLARAWTAATIVEKSSILEKYQFACLLADKEPMDLGAPAAQDLAIGVEIRNALMHFKPQSVDLPMDGSPGTLEGSWKRIGLKLKSRPSLKPSPYASQGMPEFPHRVLAHDCAERTFNGVHAFLLAFAKHLGLTNPPFSHIFSVSKTR